MKSQARHYNPSQENKPYDKSGGLRLKGFVKEDHPSLPLVSIITVVYNGKQYLEETLLSVINQDYDNIEYIIVDGGSTDGTLDVISRHEECIDLWISAKDKGTYDAMNKGMELATGTYVNFLNASDFFCDNHTVSSMIKDHKNADLIYGNIYVVDEQGNDPLYLKAHKLTFNNLLAQDCAVLNHQAIFIKKEAAPSYNLTFKYRAELNWYYDIIESLGSRGLIVHRDIPVVYYKTGGISYKKLWGPLYEWMSIEFKKGGLRGIFKKIPRYLNSILDHYGLLSPINKTFALIKTLW
ncbi:MAG: glycosyltransferase family 2 protein [Nitrospirota bacterium]